MQQQAKKYDIESVPIGKWITDPITFIEALSEHVGVGEKKRYIGLMTDERGIKSNISYHHQQLLEYDYSILEYAEAFITINRMEKAWTRKKGKKVYSMARTNANVIEAEWVWVDIDFRCMTESMEYFLHEVPRLPVQPSLILMSGRGIWIMYRISPTKDMALWKHVEKELVKAIGGMADNASTDPSRYCRLPGGINRKSGQKVQFMKLNNQVCTIDEIVEAYEIPPMEEKKPPKQKKEEKKQPKSGTNKVIGLFNLHNLNSTRCDDIIRVIEMRDGECTGYRDNMLFLFGWHLALANKDITEDELTGILMGVNSEFTNPLSQAQVNAKVKSIMNNKNELDYRGKPKYNYSNEKIVELIGITEEEAEELKTILTKGENNRRSKMRMREKRGSVPMEEYRENQRKDRENKKALLQQLEAEGKSAKEIQEILGISQTTYYRIKNNT